MAACDLNQLIEDSKCLNCLSESEKHDAFLFYLATALNTLTDEDLTSINDLRDAVKCWCVGGQVLDSFKARVAINLAVNSGALATTPTIAEIREAIKCWNCDVGGGEKKAAEVLLLCKVLEHYASL